MEYRKDNQNLDKEFPFKLSDSILAPFYNMNRIYHWHECLEISYVKSGRGRYYIEDRVIEMGPGDIIIINNVEPHYLEVYEEVMHQPVITFDPSLICSHHGHTLDYDYLKPFFDRGTDFRNKLDSDKKVTTIIMENLLAIEDEYMKRPEGYKLMIKARLLTILTFLIRHFRDSRKLSSISSNQRTHFKKLHETMKFLEENFNQEITLSQIASDFFLTPQYFSTFFKKAVGVNFSDYLNNIRINHAISLIRETDRKITHIASECGFNNMNNFNSIFKKLTGKTPSQFR